MDAVDALWTVEGLRQRQRQRRRVAGREVTLRRNKTNVTALLRTRVLRHNSHHDDECCHAAATLLATEAARVSTTDKLSVQQNDKSN